MAITGSSRIFFCLLGVSGEFACSLQQVEWKND